MNLLPILLLVVVFYLLVLRPARARQRDFVATQRALEPGARVMLASGIHGVLVSVEDTEARLEIAPGTVVTVNRQAVARVLDEPSPPPAEGVDPA